VPSNDVREPWRGGRRCSSHAGRVGQGPRSATVPRGRQAGFHRPGSSRRLAPAAVVGLVRWGQGLPDCWSVYVSVRLHPVALHPRGALRHRTSSARSVIGDARLSPEYPRRPDKMIQGVSRMAGAELLETARPSLIVRRTPWWSVSASNNQFPSIPPALSNLLDHFLRSGSGSRRLSSAHSSGPYAAGVRAANSRSARCSPSSACPASRRSSRCRLFIRVL